MLPDPSTNISNHVFAVKSYKP